MKVAKSCQTLWDPMDYIVHGILQARMLEWVAFLFSRVFPTQGSEPGLPHCRQILYQLSHKGSPRILEWVAYPFSSRSSWPRNWTRVSHIAGGFFTNWATGEAWLPCLLLHPQLLFHTLMMTGLEQNLRSSIRSSRASLTMKMGVIHSRRCFSHCSPH